MKSKKKVAIAVVAGLSAVGGVLGLRALLGAVIGRNKPKFLDNNKAMKELSDSFAPYRERMKLGTDKLRAMNCEKVNILSADGLILTGHWLQADNPERTLVMLHGFRSTWDNDFGGAIEFYNKEMNCNLLLVEQRSHGLSQGKYIGYGILERYDCVEWAKYADLRCNESLPIYLDGMSMGATTVLLASELDLPGNVKGIIADSGYTSPADILGHIIKKSYKLPETISIKFLSSLCKKTAGYGFYDRSTVDALKNNTRPVLLVHGTDDMFVPYSMSEENYEACVAPCELVLVHGAGHGLSYFVDRCRCEEAIIRLFDKCEKNTI